MTVCMVVTTFLKARDPYLSPLNMVLMHASGMHVGAPVKAYLSIGPAARWGYSTTRQSSSQCYHVIPLFPILGMPSKLEWLA
jgi:hypothetical protein